MENNILKFKKGFYPNYEIPDKSYSVCMRGARAWNINEPLLIYTKGDGDLIDTSIKVEPAFKAEIISQEHYRFQDLRHDEYCDNYDKNVTNYPSLENAMIKVYGERFNNRQIVTILRFKIIW